MNTVLENLIATIIVMAVATVIGLISQAFGFSAQVSIIIAGTVLFALPVKFLVVRSKRSVSTEDNAFSERV